MQPPPRKATSVKFLKTLHAEQIAKLQVKNQTECELLEDLRSFLIKKSSLEKSYCEALLKITSVYLNKKITTSIPDLKTEGSDERWNMWSVWRTVLEENEVLARARLTTLEVLLQNIADDSKHLRIHKLQTTKKCVDLLASIQKELQGSVQDIEKNRKIYFDEEHSAHDVRDKAKDIEARLKRKKGSFFQSLSTLQKSSAKVSLKREQLDDKSVGARNDYLLSLATANAHQNRYFVNDLQNIMQAMESEVYDKVQQYFCLIGRAELLTCSARQVSYAKLRDQAQKLSRDYNLQCLYLYYPVLKQHIQYDFEACDGDNIDYITSGSATTALQFIEEVKEWLEIVARERSAVRSYQKKMKYLLSLQENGERFDPDDPSGVDIDTKLEELQEAIRKSEVNKVKTDAKIELLKKSQDENVRDMCKKLEEELGSNLVDEEEEEEKDRLQSIRTSLPNYAEKESEYRNQSSEDDISYPHIEQNVSTDEDTGMVSSSYAPYQSTNKSDDVLKQFEASWDTLDETNYSTHEIQNSSSKDIDYTEDNTEANPLYEEFETPFKCTVLYNYEAQNPDELTITAGEELKVFGEGDGDGWLRARNSAGDEGFVPCTYLEMYTAEEEVDQNNDGVDITRGHHLTSQISFSSVDYTVNNIPTPKETVGGDSIQSGESSSSIVTAVPDNADKPYENEDYEAATEDSEYCVALYDYEGNYEAGELSFQEGQVIHILRRIVHDDIDDGWWEGELEGKVGIFPSLMVEACQEDGRSYDEDNEPISAPPIFTPPEVPQGALEESFGEAALDSQGSNADTDKFSFAMSDNQQKQYNSQFQPDSETTRVDSSECEPIIQVSVVDENETKEVPQPIVAINVIEDEDNNAQEEEEDERISDFSLRVAQIVITAPTPSSDSADKTFPPDPAPDDSQMSVSTILLERRKSAGEINEADPPLYDATLINECVDYPSTIIEEPEEEEEEEEIYNEKMLGEDKAMGPRNSIPSINASGYQPCVPEQLEPHQLQRLQKLKESNA